jgi:hypothetical protein
MVRPYGGEIHAAEPTETAIARVAEFVASLEATSRSSRSGPSGPRRCP